MIRAFQYTVLSLQTILEMLAPVTYNNDAGKAVKGSSSTVNFWNNIPDHERTNNLFVSFSSIHAVMIVRNNMSLEVFL